MSKLTELQYCTLGLLARPRYSLGTCIINSTVLRIVNLGSDPPCCYYIPAIPVLFNTVVDTVPVLLYTVYTVVLTILILLKCN